MWRKKSKSSPAKSPSIKKPSLDTSLGMVEKSESTKKRETKRQVDPLAVPTTEGTGKRNMKRDLSPTRSENSEEELRTKDNEGEEIDKPKSTSPSRVRRKTSDA